MQPSLWDRLTDDLPGLVAETEALRRDLARALGDAASADALVAGGTREIERRTDLDDDTRLLAHRLLRLLAARRRLEDGGVVVTADVLREAVRRDMEMLFNTERLEATFLLPERDAFLHKSPSDLLAAFPEVRRSVVNYGVPCFAGLTGSDIDPDALARELTLVVNTFEPRLRRDSVRVKVRPSDRAGLRIEVDGILMLSPVPERLRLSTRIDLENGQARTVLEDA
ncbi:type VI secretion system baseplate subunit TssE [Roseivivax isoporae]|uniref:IraD/Gp25-like domain-containing protein n=1 Tax=Roseivivax isoporae LMG 25204 TaxID=1449351 RepID=X7FDS7_9RHOB|nr:type VI secretion system baseplate subunit TssE [Roseivivax isoporae]ETX30236.1 hypothetical protein RISW2_15490 [Roseivivax isoporae LMG 25204]